MVQAVIKAIGRQNGFLRTLKKLMMLELPRVMRIVGLSGVGERRPRGPVFCNLTRDVYVYPRDAIGRRAGKHALVYVTLNNRATIILASSHAASTSTGRRSAAGTESWPGGPTP